MFRLALSLKQPQVYLAYATRFHRSFLFAVMTLRKSRNDDTQGRGHGDDLA